MQLSTCRLRNVLSAKCSGRSVSDFLEKGAFAGWAEVDRAGASDGDRKARAGFWKGLRWRRIRPRFCRALNAEGLWFPHAGIADDTENVALLNVERHILHGVDSRAGGGKGLV